MSNSLKKEYSYTSNPHLGLHGLFWSELYLVSADHNGMAAHLTISDCKGFCEVLYIQRNMDGTADEELWNDSEESVNVNTLQTGDADLRS